MDAATDAAVEEAYGLLTELGRYGWDVDVLPGFAGASLILTASKGETTLSCTCKQVVDSALELYRDALRLDQLRLVETHH